MLLIVWVRDILRLVAAAAQAAVLADGVVVLVALRAVHARLPERAEELFLAIRVERALEPGGRAHAGALALRGVGVAALAALLALARAAGAEVGGARRAVHVRLARRARAPRRAGIVHPVGPGVALGAVRARVVHTMPTAPQANRGLRGVDVASAYGAE